MQVFVSHGTHFRGDKCSSYVLCKLRSKLFNAKGFKFVLAVVLPVPVNEELVRNVWCSREDLGTEFTGVVSASFDSEAENWKKL